MKKFITILKSPFSSGSNTPMTRSRANSIDLDSSYDMIGEEERALIMAERARVLEELLASSGFMNGPHETHKKSIKRTVIMPNNTSV
jgi:hypothetical protein